MSCPAKRWRRTRSCISPPRRESGGLPSCRLRSRGADAAVPHGSAHAAYEDDTLGMYYAFGFRDNTVTGASMYRSPDELAWEVLGTGNDGPCSAGRPLCCPMTTKPVGHGMKRSKVQIALTQGTLDSKTALEVLNWANVAMLGDEIIQWRNATCWPAVFTSCPVCCAVGAAPNGQWHTCDGRTLCPAVCRRRLSCAVAA
jgi:hypothetical protein